MLVRDDDAKVTNRGFRVDKDEEGGWIGAISAFDAIFAVVVTKGEHNHNLHQPLAVGPTRGRQRVGHSEGGLGR